MLFRNQENRENYALPFRIYTSKLRIYPIVQIICILPATLNRLMIMLGHDIISLTYIQTIFDSGQGAAFAISLMYHIHDYEKFFNCCRKVKKNLVFDMRMDEDTIINTYQNF